MNREAAETRDRFDHILVTCEHAASAIPPRYAPLFDGARGLLPTHRGIDVGALGVARQLSAALRVASRPRADIDRLRSAPDGPGPARGAARPLRGVALQAGRTSRLLVELNRSLHHRHLFSRYVAHLDRAAKEEILRRHYHPYRDGAASWIARHLSAGLRVFHLSVHSFTPILRGQVRQVDIGLMYDPARRVERELCARWRVALRDADPRLRVRRNHPYRGVADGFQPHLRGRFAGPQYTAVEMEINQKHLRPGARTRPRVVGALRRSLLRVLHLDVE